jgi:hypothetical protein
MFRSKIHQTSCFRRNKGHPEEKQITYLLTFQTTIVKCVYLCLCHAAGLMENERKNIKLQKKDVISVRKNPFDMLAPSDHLYY